MAIVQRSTEIKIKEEGVDALVKYAQDNGSVKSVELSFSTRYGELSGMIPSDELLRIYDAMLDVVTATGLLNHSPKKAAEQEASGDMPKIWVDLLKAISDWGDKDGGATVAEIAVLMGKDPSILNNHLL